MRSLTYILLVCIVGVGLTLGTLAMRQGRDVRAFAKDDPVQKTAPSDSDDSNPAVNDPDQFAWKVFVRINSAAKNNTNDAIWETWATDDDTFPTQPDPTKPPAWPGDASKKKVLQPSHQQMLRRKLLEASPHNQFLRE